MAPTPQPSRTYVAGQSFETTHWSVVLAAGHQTSTRAQAALENLCHTYWYPLYAYLRRRGYAEPDAQDLTQGFFAQILQGEFFKRATPNKGRFRSFLIGALNYFLADARDKAQAAKRGGAQTPISIDAQEAEGRYRLEPTDPLTPEKIYERRWALTVLDQVLVRLEKEYVQAGKAALFAQVQVFLLREQSHPPYAELAAQLSLTEGAFKTAVYRLRVRYREMFHEEIANTVSDPREVDEELRYLFTVMSQ